jgi:transposase-like protein
MYSTVQFDENGKVLYYNPNITKDTYLCHACGIKFSVDNKGNIEEDTIVFVDSTYKNENKI